MRVKHLYEHGKRFTCYPLRVTYLLTDGNDDSYPVVLFWAPKSLFKHAVSRNRLRRQMREAYRLNNLTIKQYCSDNHISMQIAFNYITKDELSYLHIEKAMRKALYRLSGNEEKLKSDINASIIS